jgi:flagellar hook-associated protein 3 FlgL
MNNLNGASELFLSDVGRIQRRLADATRQLSSGRKVQSAADAPDQVGPILQLHSELQRNSQIKTNLAIAQTEADGADSAMASAIKLMDRARTLAAQGADSTLDNSSRTSIAQEIESIQEQVVSISATTVQGRYIFSGDDDARAPYAFDQTSNNSVTQITTAGSTRRVEDPAGGSFPVAMTAQAIFDARNDDGTSADDNVFASLDSLRQALLANDVDAVKAANGSVQKAEAHLNSAEAFYGTVQRRIETCQSYANSYDTQLQRQLSQKVDADAAAAAMEMTQANTQLQAAFQMRAKLPQTTLFDFLA